MGKLITAALLLLSVGISACDKAPNLAAPNSSNNSNGSQQTGSADGLISYRFKSGQCDTYKRSFKTQRELCYAIQVDELNNNCASSERLAYFTQKCETFTEFNSEKAKQALIHVNGKYVTCSLHETGLPELLQYTATNQLTMEHTASRAFVQHSLSELKIGLRMSIYDVASGRLLKATQKVWTDETEVLTLSAAVASGTSVLTCLVNLADDPNRN